MDEQGASRRTQGTDALLDPPTSVRWRILALLIAYALMCHFNRISISVAGAEHIIKEHINPELSISETQMGMVYSSYLFVYTLCMIPGGWLIDRFGPRKALMLVGFGSAILVPMTGLTSYTSGISMLLALCVVRGLLGLFNAPIHPGAARAVSFWMPYQARGVANGLVTAAAVIGVASTYYVFGYLMDRVGWPSAFLVAGVITLVLTIGWSVYATDRPSKHLAVNDGERKLIEDGDPALFADSQAVPPSGDLPGETGGDGGLVSMLQNRSLVLLTVSYAMYSYFQYLFFYWTQHYFENVLKLGKDDGRKYATIIMVAMAAGMMGGGWFSDFVQSRWGHVRSRSIAPVCGMTASAILLIVGLLVTQPLWIVTCFALAMGALGLSESSFWVTGVELGGRRGGLSGAFLNAVGNAGGILAPVITPLFSHYFGWKAGLGLASVFCFIGAVLWLGIDPRERHDAPATNPLSRH